MELPVYAYAGEAERSTVEPITVLRSVFEAPLRRDVMHR
jgi:hypothetical protein